MTIEQAMVVEGPRVGMEEAVMALLPPTGSVEVQRDNPGREHPLHTHPTDETLLILEGSITFGVGEEERTCGPGDRLLLPKETPHSSVAGPDGCIYIIALEVAA